LRTTGSRWLSTFLLDLLEPAGNRRALLDRKDARSIELPQTGLRFVELL
jgi:hypothetical protein